MRFVVPLPPNLANARMHWRTKHEAKKSYWSAMDVLQQIGEGAHPMEVPPPPAEPFAKARARVTLYLHQPMDDGNAGNRLKWLEDWLVTRGYIVDDRKQVLEYEGYPEQVIDRKWKRVELELTEAV